MWLTGSKPPSRIHQDQNHAVYDAVRAILDKLRTYNSKNLHLLILNSSFLLIIFKLAYSVYNILALS